MGAKESVIEPEEDEGNRVNPPGVVEEGVVPSMKAAAEIPQDIERITREMFLDLSQAKDIVAPISKFDAMRARDGCVSRAQAERLLRDEVNVFMLPLEELRRSATSMKFPIYRRDLSRLVNLQHVRRPESFLVFLSRRNDGSRRDSAEEFKHCLAAVEYLYENSAFGMENCYVWYDSLAENDDNYFSVLDYVMSSSDCVVTPVFDNEFAAVVKPKPNGRKPILQCDGIILDEHMQWQKSRVEMYYAAYMPCTLDPQRMRELRGDLYVALSTFGRPHFLFNTDSPHKICPISMLPYTHAGLDVAICSPKVGQSKNLNMQKAKWDALATFLEAHYVPPNYERARYQGAKDDEGLFCGHGKLFFENGGVYAGEFRDNFFHGFGKLMSPSGGSFEGSFAMGKIHGEGRMIYNSGDLYIGSFVSNLRQGRGKFVEANGDMFQGEFLADARSGEGETIFVNGNRYSGTYHRDKPHGFGQLVFSNGDVYDGTFCEGLRQGDGRFTYSNGNVYRGNWTKNMRSGHGTLSMVSGAEYTGSFVEDRMEGAGQLVHPDGNLYRGNFVNNLPHGSGVYSWTNGDVYEGTYSKGLQNGQGHLKLACGSEYQGAWVDSKKHGIGKYTSCEGHSYYGDYRFDFMHGNGRFEWANGDYYEGHFQRNQMHGKGKLKHKSGNVFIGEFKEDKKDGKGKLYNASGVVYNGYWQNGIIKSSLGQKVHPRGITLLDPDKEEEPEDPNVMKLLDDDESTGVDRSVMTPSSNFRNKFGPGDPASELPDFLVGKIKPSLLATKSSLLAGDSMTLESGSSVASLGAEKKNNRRRSIFSLS